MKLQQANSTLARPLVYTAKTEAACLPVAVTAPRHHIPIFSIVYQVVSATSKLSQKTFFESSVKRVISEC